VRFSEDKVAQGQQLTNKLWNAARLVLLGVGPDARADVRPAAVEDGWILTRLHHAEAEISRRIDGFDFSHAALALYDFVYGELCDWYLELVKPRLRAGEPELHATLLYVLTRTLVLAHPLIPFVTEEIYRYVPGAEGLLAAGLPANPAPVDADAEAALSDVIEAVQALRAWRDSAGVKPGVAVPARLIAEGYQDTVQHVGRLAQLRLSADGDSDGGSPVATVRIPGGAVEILPAEAIDVEAAARKLAARREKLESEIARAEGKLANHGFVAKAPAPVVEAEREKLTRLQAELAAL
jgi:valyl-tRNA synthetase